jgi:hypothetical protein
MLRFFETMMVFVLWFFIFPILACVPTLILINIFNIEDHLVIALMGLSIFLISSSVYQLIKKKNK